MREKSDSKVFVGENVLEEPCTTMDVFVAGLALSDGPGEKGNDWLAESIVDVESESVNLFLFARPVIDEFEKVSARSVNGTADASASAWRFLRFCFFFGVVSASIAVGRFFSGVTGRASFFLFGVRLTLGRHFRLAEFVPTGLFFLLDIFPTDWAVPCCRLCWEDGMTMAEFGET